MTVQGLIQGGDWYRVHHRETHTAVEREVFSLWIDHGAEPHGARYAYVVYPDVTADQTQGLANAQPFKIVQQTASVLAISSEGGRRIQAAFFEAGKLTCDEDTAIEVDTPCLIMWDQAANRLHVADPTHRCEAIHVRISGRVQKKIAIDLPDEGDAGRTIGVDLGR